MALSYTEYKELNGIALESIKAMLESYEQTGLQPSIEQVSMIEYESYRHSGLEDRMADVMSTRGFLGFIMMVNTHPGEFYKDIDFWVECHLIGIRVLEAVSAGQDQEMVDILLSVPDVVMSKRFVINPSSIIKGS